MDAPEKFYTDGNGLFPMSKRHCDSDIEYVRKDVFIEKAKKYLEERFINEVSIIAAGPVNIQFNQAFENFKEYMKSE